MNLKYLANYLMIFWNNLISNFESTEFELEIRILYKKSRNLIQSYIIKENYFMKILLLKWIT